MNGEPDSPQPSRGPAPEPSRGSAATPEPSPATSDDVRSIPVEDGWAVGRVEFYRGVNRLEDAVRLAAFESRKAAAVSANQAITELAWLAASVAFYAALLCIMLTFRKPKVAVK